MLYFKSWRWSRLTEVSALKRVVTHPNELNLLSFSLWLIFTTTASIDNPKVFTPVYWQVTGAIFLINLLINICTADKYFEIKTGKLVQLKIYLYNSGIFSSKKTVKMVTVQRNFGEEFIREAEIESNFRFWKDSHSFLFCVEDEYYYLSPRYQDLKFLGNRLSETVFLSLENREVNILNHYDVLTLKTNLVIREKIFVPPMALTKIDIEPDEYLITKEGTTYSVYGLIDNNYSPEVFPLYLSTVIFKEGEQDVVLVWKEGIGYEEIFRTQRSIKRSVNETFIELSADHGTDIKGIVRRFNEQTMQIETIYEGMFYLIDFENGEVVGENGFEYKPPVETFTLVID